MNNPVTALTALDEALNRDKVNARHGGPRSIIKESIEYSKIKVIKDKSTKVAFRELAVSFLENSFNGMLKNVMNSSHIIYET